MVCRAKVRWLTFKSHSMTRESAMVTRDVKLRWYATLKCDSQIMRNCDGTPRKIEMVTCGAKVR